MFDLAIFGQHLFNGLLIGCAYALIAIGLTMIFGVMNIANFAHGEFYMIGGFFAFYLVSLAKINYFLARPIVPVAAGRLCAESDPADRFSARPVETLALAGHPHEAARQRSSDDEEHPGGAWRHADARGRGVW